MKTQSIYHYCAIVGFCAAIAITPLSLSAQTTTNNDGSAATTLSDRNLSARADRVDRDDNDTSWIGLLGLVGLAGLLGRKRREEHHETTRAPVRA